MLAKALENAITIRSTETLPDGVKVVQLDVADYIDFIRKPHAIEYDGEIYGRSGWNSDRHVAYYRSDVKPAFAAKW
jgi:hypothetical protein